MSVTLPVSQLDKLSDAMLEQPLNMAWALVIAETSTLARLKLVQMVKSLNSSEQSPVKRTMVLEALEGILTVLTAEAFTSLPHLLFLLKGPQLSHSVPVALSKL